MAGIQDTIAHRRAAGEYPAGLEQELEAEFASILALTHRGEADRADALELILEEAKRCAPEVSGLTPTSSRVPFLNILHKIMRRLIARQTRGLAAQQRAVNDQLIAMLEHLVADARGREEPPIGLERGEQGLAHYRSCCEEGEAADRARQESRRRVFHLGQKSYSTSRST